MDFDLTPPKKPEIIIPTRRTKQEEQALKIINDIKNKKIQLRPTTDTHIGICNNLRSLIYRYDRLRSLPSYLTRGIIQSYEEAEFYGLIEKSESVKVTERDHVINEKNEKIAKLTKQLAKYEGNDKPDDAVYSDISEEND